MSRIGNKPVPVPAGVKLTLEGSKLTVNGPKGELSHIYGSLVSLAYDKEAAQVVLTRADDGRNAKAQHGLSRTLTANMIQGVTNGWSKQLEIRGIGYRGAVQGSNLSLTLGYSHPINYPIPAGIKVTMPDQTKITVEGADKQLVGQVAADIRFFRKPEPYKGKGIRYVGEFIAMKEGKAAGKKK
jgi:large subunit ribosomal protein L6